MPVIVTNQVRYQSGAGGNETTFPFAGMLENRIVHSSTCHSYLG